LFSQLCVIKKRIKTNKMNTTKKIALVTGGSRGLGKNMALSIAKRGIDVIITYNSNETEANKVVAAIEALGQKGATLQLNTGNIQSFDAFLEKLRIVLNDTFGATHFDFLINNAGIGLHAPIANTTEEQFDALMNIHFKGVFFLTQKVLPFINDGGRIINISSGLARFALPGAAAYAAMKGAVETFTRYLAKELGGRGITANVVAPGAIETDFNGGGVRDNAELNKFVASVTALGRAGLPDDIGGLVSFLCTEDARWITGQRIEASGGMFV
jgi:NAD(P)-dependent dehydrogenase (short-subunit alcohol dehydrogenase family)